MQTPSITNRDPNNKNFPPGQKIAVKTDSVLNRILLVLAILSGCGVIATIFFYQRKLGSVLMVVALLTTIVIAKIMLHHGYARLSGIWTICGVWLTFAFNVLMGNGLNSVNVVFFISTSVIAGLLLGQKATIWVAGTGIATASALAGLAVTGYLPDAYFVQTPLGNLVNLVFAIVVTTTALNMALRERDNALNIANQQLSDRLEAEDALRKSEERYRSLVENADEAILVIQDGILKFVNSLAIQSFGYSREELLSIPAFELIYPEDRNAVVERYMQKINGDTAPTRHTYRVIPKSGRVAWIEISSVLIDWEGRPATLNLITDITNRRKVEEEKRTLEERLNRAEKMEALGQLAGGVAHDLNNVLGALTGYSELLMMEMPEGQKTRIYAEKILQSTEKGAAIIQDLLTLARRGVAASDVININDVVRTFLKTPVFERIKGYHPRITFNTDCQENLLHIKGSSVHLEKTIMNLISNAAEAITGQGEVTIRTVNRYLDRSIMGFDEVREGDYVVLEVSDTGIGISEEDREKIFEPFYTKKIMGRSGTGLGLSIVWGTVKDHNGYIDVRSVAGEGTTFTLYFPVTREEPVVQPKVIPLDQYLGRGESVLVIDDIVEQRDVACGLLTKLGYKVHTVASGEEAVEYLEKNQSDILVLDMIMAPGIDGLETYQRILNIHPKQKAILVSGFSETDRVKQAQRLGAGAYVKKPYVMEKIGLALRQELNRQ